MQATVAQVAKIIEEFAPLSYQESYDNSGLLCGNPNSQVQNCLLSLDCTPQVVQEAIDKNCQMIVSHHPILFSGLKSITGKNYVEQALLLAIKNDIALYACHTNLDNVHNGVNHLISSKLALQNTRILHKKGNTLSKICVYVPNQNLAFVNEAMQKSGAGNIGNYDYCSYSSSGQGTFRANSQANPYVGGINQIHTEPETKLEVLCPNHKINAVVKSMLAAHPYEEVAYDIVPLANQWQLGSGMIGELETPMPEQDFLNHVKTAMQTEIIKYTPVNKTIKTVAVCGGSGSFLLSKAKAQKADAYISSDFKYHEYFDAENQVMICDIGHYETEKFTIEIFMQILSGKFSNFAPHFSAINTNPVKYYI